MCDFMAEYYPSENFYKFNIGALYAIPMVNIVVTSALHTMTDIKL